MEKIQPTADCIVARLTPNWGSRVSLLFKATEPYEHYYDENGDEVSYGAIVSWTDVELPPESEDERIRKSLVGYFGKFKPQDMWDEMFSFGDVLSYLERQKDILWERVQNITANMLEDRIEGIQHELIEFLSNTIDASWVDIIKSADSYAERIKNIIEKQKKQPASGSSEKPNNHKEWSEEDDYFINMLILHFNYLIDKGGDSVETYKSYREQLKSLRPQPHWKPSEEQMYALKNVVETYRQRHNISVGGDCIFIGVESLYNDLKKLI